MTSRKTMTWAVSHDPIRGAYVVDGWTYLWLPEQHADPDEDVQRATHEWPGADPDPATTSLDTEREPEIG